MEAGISIIGNLIIGLLKAIPDLVASLPQIMNAIIDGFYALMGSVADIGVDIVKGIWNGIKSMAGWIGDQVAGFFGGLIDGAKNLLGIHSPSTVFADMGKNMALGLGNGWDGAFSSVRKGITDGMDFGTATVDFASSGLGISSAGIINSVASGGGEGWANGLTVNLTLPDGSKFATWQLPYLIKAGSAAGTPIAEAQRA